MYSRLVCIPLMVTTQVVNNEVDPPGLNPATPSKVSHSSCHRL